MFTAALTARKASREQAERGALITCLVAAYPLCVDLHTRACVRPGV